MIEFCGGICIGISVALFFGALAGRWIERKSAQAEIEAQSAIIGWYEDEMDRGQYDEEDVPEELLDLETQLCRARYG